MNTYFVRTFGCQMNKHDSERIAGLLEALDMSAAARPEEADVVVFNTCCVRESADERLYGQVTSLAGRRPGTLIAVGGCIGQRDGEELLARLPGVDVVFGTHDLAALPTLLEAANDGKRHAHVPTDDRAFSSELPSLRENPWHAWLPIAVGCDNHCTYCIVPYVRGPERSRALDDIAREAADLVSDGVVEITLLGQNVDSYGRDLYGEPRFAEVLRAVADTGVPRIRFATSHPKDISGKTIEAIASLPAVMPYLHLPVQSGSDRILGAMNRGYDRATYRAIVQRVREAVPEISLSTDIIVGFPGETDADFEDTLALLDEVHFDHAFTFIYSPRAQTPAASLPGRLADEVASARFEALAERVRQDALASNLREVGKVRTVLLEGPSKRDRSTLSARTPANRLVHLPSPPGADPAALAGTFAEVRITEAQSWFLRGALLD